MLINTEATNYKAEGCFWFCFFGEEQGDRFCLTFNG